MLKKDRKESGDERHCAATMGTQFGKEHKVRIKLPVVKTQKITIVKEKAPGKPE